MSQSFIQIRNLTKSYPTPAGELNVLRNINLDVQKGDFIALIGPSGSGKTTFLNMLTAIDAPTSGEIRVGGMNIMRTPQRKLTRWRAQNIGIIFQFFQLLPSLSVENNIVAPMDLANVWKPKERQVRAHDLLSKFGIQDQAYKTPDMLSGGQKQRVALARAFANQPALIIGDEPTGNLDRMSARNVFDQFHALSEAGTTIIIVTHDRELVRGVPKIFELNDGMINATTVEATAKRRTEELQTLHLAG